MRQWRGVLGVTAATLLLAACQPRATLTMDSAPPARSAGRPAPTAQTAPRPPLVEVRPHPYVVDIGESGDLPPAAPLAAFYGSGPKVVVIGDSLAASTTDESRPLLWGDHQLSWNAVGSTKWADWTPVARSVRAAKPDVVVVELGTNDLWNGWQASDQLGLNRFLRGLAAPACTILVGYASGGPVLDLFGNPNPAYVAAEPRGNAALQLAAALRTAGRAPTIWADWSAASRGRPFFAIDNVHLNQAGQDAWAQWTSGLVRHVTETGTCELAGAETTPG